MASLNREILKQYKKGRKELATSFNKWTRSIRFIGANKLKQLQAGEITQKDYAGWLEKQLMHAGWAHNMMNELTGILQKADKGAVQSIDKAVPKVYSDTEFKTLYAIDKSVGISANFTLQNERAVEAAMKRKLLPHVDEAKNAKWNYRRLSSAITQGIVQGDSIPDIAKRIEHVGVANGKAAIRTARTATNAAENAGKFEAYKEAEELGLEITKIWLATVDDRTRDSHVLMDGEEVGIDEEFSNGLMYPCDPDGNDEEVYNCRCRMITRCNGQEIDMSGRSNKTGMSYEEWKDAHRR